MVLLTLNPEGTLLWQRDLAVGGGADARGGVTVARDGSIYVAGGLQAIQGTSAVNDTLLARFSPPASWSGTARTKAPTTTSRAGSSSRPTTRCLSAGSTQSPFVGRPSVAYLLNVDAKGKGIACNSVTGPGSTRATP